MQDSRSGNGAHVWFFFSGPVPASAARKMGCYLLTETLSRRHQLGMDSYDRLFPSQDTLPRGGFGNLIALPLQREARRAGATQSSSMIGFGRSQMASNGPIWRVCAESIRPRWNGSRARPLERGPSSEFDMRKWRMRRPGLGLHPGARSGCG